MTPISVLAVMIVLPGLVLMINPSLPMIFNSSLVTIDEMMVEVETVPAINVVDLPANDIIL